MNLTDRNQRPRASPGDSSELAQEFCPIVLDCGWGILRGEAEIQSSPSVNFGKSCWPSAEAVNEPRNQLQRISLQDFELSLSESSERH